MNIISKVISVMLLTALVTGCSILRCKTQNTSICPFRLDYNILMQKNGQYIEVVVEHLIVNKTDSDILICDVPERAQCQWEDHWPTNLLDPSDLDPTDKSASVGGALLVETKGCFVKIHPKQSLYIDHTDIRFHCGATSLTYQGTQQLRRDGHWLGLNAWTGDVEGSQVTLPIQGVQSNAIPPRFGGYRIHDNPEVD